eukprot:520826-Pyramimonas_sp.AAC.1
MTLGVVALRFPVALVVVVVMRSPPNWAACRSSMYCARDVGAFVVSGLVLDALGKVAGVARMVLRI